MEISIAASELVQQQIASTVACTPSSIVLPSFPNLEIATVQAEVVDGYSRHIEPGRFFGNGALNVSGVEFCNVSVVYIHSNHHVPVHVQVWLPTESAWNGRMMGSGGGGWTAGLSSLCFDGMAGGLFEGYATLATDAGHDPNRPDLRDWVLDAHGEVDMYLLENFAYTSLYDATLIGKEVIQNFYGRSSTYNYWNGCSTGGRQGMELAQRYPDAYDGILSMAPALNGPSVLMWMNWAQQLMNELGGYPCPCEFEALREAAVEACDLDDGVPDGIIADSDTCEFDPFDQVGRTIFCEDSKQLVNISGAAAQVAYEVWQGVTTRRGSLLWPGPSLDAQLAGPGRIANTVEVARGHRRAAPLSLSEQWISVVLKEDPDFDLTTLTREDFVRLFSHSVIRYDPVLASNNPDLSRFRDRGGKILMVHGSADELIPIKGTRRYHDSVARFDTCHNVSDYYRYFEAPGMAHCFGGNAPQPNDAWTAMVKWVEHGQAPEQLVASWSDGGSRPLCQYPLVARYSGMGDWKDYNNYYCAETHLSTRPLRIIVQRATSAVMKYLSGGKPQVSAATPMYNHTGTGVT